MSAVRAAILAGLLLSGPALAAQQPASVSGCVLVIEHVGSQGVRDSTAAGVNYFAGGGVAISCRGRDIHMQSDSLAAFAGRTFKFVGQVHYRDSTLTMTADTGTYFKDGERWEARGHVVTRNLENGSALKGPSLDYLRPERQLRDTAEMFAVGRPVIDYVVKDSAGNPGEPYRIVADRVRMRGNNRVWAAGRVTIDRSDFAARGDSLRLFTGPQGDGTMLGLPVLKQFGRDTFDLTGRRIDFTLADRELTGVTAKDTALATTADRKLTADTISLGLAGGKLARTDAWGRTRRPHVVSPDYEVRSDSLVLETPGQLLRLLRAYGGAVLITKPDSVTQERDWIAGDTVVARFVPRDSLSRSGAAPDTGRQKATVLHQMDAYGRGRAYHASRSDAAPGRAALNYVRADRIVISMQNDGSSVDQVAVSGHVEGVQLEPDTTTAPPPGAAPPPSTPAAGRPASPVLPPAGKPGP